MGGKEWKQFTSKVSQDVRFRVCLDSATHGDSGKQTLLVQFHHPIIISLLDDNDNNIIINKMQYI